MYITFGNELYHVRNYQKTGQWLIKPLCKDIDKLININWEKESKNKTKDYFQFLYGFSSLIDNKNN